MGARVLKAVRDATRLAADLGCAVLESGRNGRHHYLRLRTPGGHEFKFHLPADMGSPRMWMNLKTQLRTHIRTRDHQQETSP